ncbi:hypothetical protein [Saccharothrix violaceirubra]|uniref:Uncharacterized protein n=1 Tax=Saccharothrix violaceirubra TaxID=413306 RepID=A0A7W7WY14_9PSEU|nr:hypothetical protein [Saccharothrix violaceirubra]MBB4968029.1 hypothetical protein [Saccharothrix violaceirubra]
MFRDLRACLALMFLAPLVGEFLLGNVPIVALPALVFLVPMYGGAALLCRELARRTGRGLPTMLLLGAAFGVLLAGVIDQSMFNPDFEGHDFQATTPIPALGISALKALSFPVGHAVWSIGTPIVLVESSAWSRRTTPWLGVRGLIAVGVVFVAGSAAVFRFMYRKEGFLASPAQLGSAILVAALLTTIAFRLPRTGSRRDRWVPHPVLLGIGSFVATSVFSGMEDSWTAFAVDVVMIVVIASALVWFANSTRWRAGHRFGTAAGALLTYAWLGWFLVVPAPPFLLAHGVLVVLFLVLLVVCGRKVRLTAGP